jgi:anti-anti-sigma factor
VEPNRSSSHGSRRTSSAPAAAAASFSVDVQRRDDVVIVQPHGELDLVTVDRLRAALDPNAHTGRLVLDLRGLSFIDSTGLHLLLALNQHAERDGFELTLVMPPAPANRAIELAGLDHALPFLAPEEADRQPWMDLFKRAGAAPALPIRRPTDPSS